MPVAASMTIDTSELHDLFGQFTGPEFTRRLWIAMEKSLAKIAADASEIAPRDTGLLAASQAWTVWPEGDDLWGAVYNPLMYAPAVEWGRMPGERPPPRGALLGWMSRHGIPMEVENAIRYSIQAHGTIPKPFLGPAFDVNIDYMTTAVAEAFWEIE